MGDYYGGYEMKIAKLQWEGNEEESSAYIFNKQLEYCISLKNKNKLRYPSAKITLENCFEIVETFDFEEDWTMVQCKELCQKHFESMIKTYLI